MCRLNPDVPIDVGKVTGRLTITTLFPGNSWPPVSSDAAGASGGASVGEHAGGAEMRVRRIRRERNFGDRPFETPLGMAVLTLGSSQVGCASATEQDIGRSCAELGKGLNCFLRETVRDELDFEPSITFLPGLINALLGTLWFACAGGADKPCERPRGESSAGRARRSRLRGPRWAVHPSGEQRLLKAPRNPLTFASLSRVPR